MRDTARPKGAELTSQFGALLRQLRLQAGMTQEQLAERSKVGVRTIRGVETGERADPRVVTVRLLADALDLTPDQREEVLAAAVGQAQRERPTPQPAEPAPREPVSQLPDNLAEAADQLAQAVRTRWQREEEQRQIHDPFPLPVRWRTAPENLSDHWANIRRLPPGSSGDPLPLTGQLDQVVAVYRRIPSGRLVVLGRAGSGKTILTLRFVLDLLAIRTRTDDPVPVIVSLGAWNPTTTPLRDWLTSNLTRDHPGLAATGPTGTTLAAALVEAGRILPVLDGFDEIAHGLHQPALDALNATTLRWLLTSRPAEYAVAVAATKAPTSAAAIELTDLTLTDVVDYLPRTTRKTTSGTVWDPVLTHLRERPRSRASLNLAKVLTTPLMVTLARTIYSDTPDDNPADLLDTTRFPSQDDLEDHLLDNLVPTVYRHHPHFDPDHAQRWLGYLASHLDQLRSHDLAWWQLGASLRRTTRILLIALITGFAVGLVDLVVNWVVYGTIGGFGFGRGLVAGLLDGLLVGLAVALAFGVAYGIVDVFDGAVREPSRVRIRIRRGRGEVRERFLPRFLLGLFGGIVFGLGVGLVIGLVNWLMSGLVGWLLAGLADALVFGIVFGLGAGLVGGLMTWFEAPLDLRSAVSPGDLLNTNRRTAVFQLLVWGPVFGLVVGFGGGLATMLLQGVVGTLVFGLTGGLVWGFVGAIGGGIGYMLNLTAWGQWLVFSRMWLPLTGRLPWAVLDFLDDAYQRGVLRQAGAVYQFRHARLQDRLTYVFRATRPKSAGR